MLTTSKEIFLNEAANTLSQIHDSLIASPTLNLSELTLDNTALLVVDMVNGFVNEGPLASPRVAAIAPRITEITKRFQELNTEIIMLADQHTETSPEFKSYPPHCIGGTRECQVIDSLTHFRHRLIPKGSTNGFMEQEFQRVLLMNPQLITFVVVGDCTDICIEQLAKTIKAYFTATNKEVRVIVPMDAVATFDLGLHNGDLMQVMALFSMQEAGIEVVSRLNLNE